MVKLVHPSGNANVREVLLALDDEAQLGEYVTFLATIGGNLFDKLAKLPGGAEFERRRIDARYVGKVASKPWPELMRLIAQRFGWDWLIRHQNGLFCPDQNNKRLGRFAVERLRHPRHEQWQAVYCYEDTALESFTAAKELGLKTIYDLPTGYWRANKQLFQEEREREPLWSQLLPALKDSEAKLERKERELDLADVVITASRFTTDTLAKFPGKRPPIFTIPYGAPAVVGRKIGVSSDEKLKCLFVGSLSQQKGLSYMFQALRLVDAPIEMTVIGRSGRTDFQPLNEALSGVSYIPSLPNSEILELMRQQDVLLFPTLFDGFGLVLVEAMSRGCVVIASPNCGAPDIVTNGEDGFIVPIRDPRAIAEKLELLHRDRDRLAVMSRAASTKAGDLTWAAYRQAIASTVRGVLAKKVA